LLTFLFPSSTHQLEDIGTHGTKVIIYNLWLNDEGIYELSFHDDNEVTHTCPYIYSLRYPARGVLGQVFADEILTNLLNYLL